MRQVLALLSTLALSLEAAMPAVGQEPKVTLVLIGDSYLSSYNVDIKNSFAVQLEAALNTDGPVVRVLDTGFTSTAAKGPLHLDRFMTDPNVLGTAALHAVILELGQNDCGFFKLNQTKAGLETMLSRLAEADIPVLVVGTEPYTYCHDPAHPDYATDYVQIFADLAEKYGDLYYRDFKDGVTGRLDLTQGDRDHPNAQGDAVIVAQMLPSVHALVARVKLP